MHPALRYLLVRQSIGGMRHRISRLRNPRYLVIVLVGVGYFWLTFGMPGVWTSDKNPFGQYVSLMPTFGGFALGSLLTLHWFTAATRPA